MSRPKLPSIPDLPAALARRVEQIPPGRVATCGALARSLGDPLAARWVGEEAWRRTESLMAPMALSTPPHRSTGSGERGHAPPPWHRIVRADGHLGPLSADARARKAALLVAEGLHICGDQVELCEGLLLSRFRGRQPLERLREAQREIELRVDVSSAGGASPPARTGRSPAEPRRIAGVDVAYPARGQGRAALVTVDPTSGEAVYSRVVRRKVRFPYITSYLSFRELPLLLAVIDRAARDGQHPDILLVDGSGVLHPRGAGSASHLGVLIGRPTVGVTKKLLCGEVDIGDMAPGESRPVTREGRPFGLALRPTAGSRRPIFISPGHLIDLAEAERVVRSVLLGRRLPEPIRLADRLAGG